jgi:serine/threonine protein kinase
VLDCIHAMKYCTVCKEKYEDSVSFCPVDGEVLEDDPSSIVNTVLDGQYQIEAMLGKGGMGAVYRARHILLGDRVAIKVLPPEVRNNAEWLRRFRREGQAARRFRHPNAVTVYDLRTASDGTIYMVMEYVEGHTLDAELRRRGRFTPAEAVQTLEPIMSVLNTAHAMGVVHRDLKPENIMIGKGADDGQPVVKLLDLGIAKMREIAGADNGGTTALTMAGQVLGTPYYMSPEQWGEIPNDGSSEIDGRADIYSLGLVFYEMIAGRRPCSGTTLSELRREHVSVPVKPLNETVPSVSPAFSAAISRATAKDRSQRQPTASDLAKELKAAVEGGDSFVLDRTMPDIPHAGSSSAHTAGFAGAAETKSDVNAPTILTTDSAAITGSTGATATQPPAAKPNVPPPVAPSSNPALKESAPTIIESKGLQESSVTVPHVAPSTPAPVIQTPVAAPTPTSAPASKRGPLILVGVGALLLLLVVAGVGGFLLFKSKSEKGPTEVKTSASGSAPTSTTREVGRYWLELLSDSPGSNPVPVAGVVPLASAQKLRFKFRFSEQGYVYIVGPGEGNKPTAFLTAKPIAESGLVTNQVLKNAEFSFPSGNFEDGVPRSLTLDKNAGTDQFTIIFSPTPLSSPSFLTQTVTGEPLNDSQRAELDGFLAKYSGSSPATELNNAKSDEPFVLIKVPQATNSSEPVVFTIRIEHK